MYKHRRLIPEFSFCPCTFQLHLFHTGFLAGGREIDATDKATEMTATGTECRTTEGELCVFPFRDGDGKLHHECTWEYAFKKNGPGGGNRRAWCGTTKEVDDGQWGDCGKGCTITGVYITY